MRLSSLHKLVCLVPAIRADNLQQCLCKSSYLPANNIYFECSFSRQVRLLYPSPDAECLATQNYDASAILAQWRRVQSRFPAVYGGGPAAEGTDRDIENFHPEDDCPVKLSLYEPLPAGFLASASQCYRPHGGSRQVLSIADVKQADSEHVLLVHRNHETTEKGQPADSVMRTLGHDICFGSFVILFLFGLFHHKILLFIV